MPELRSPGSIEPRYGEYSSYERQLLSERLQDLKNAYKAFKTAKLKDESKDWRFHLNQSILITVCLLYLNDLKEFKIFHDAEIGTDHYKRAAYLSRWISNMRPIQFNPNYDIENIELLNLNEEFATFVFLLFIGTDPSSVDSPIIDAVSRDLRFIFKFRDPQRELLVALARAIEFAVMGERTNMPPRTSGGASS